jgi:hypothetical protein
MCTGKARRAYTGTILAGTAIDTGYVFAFILLAGSVSNYAKSHKRQHCCKKDPGK